MCVLARSRHIRRQKAVGVVAGAAAVNESFTYYPSGNRETATNVLTGLTTTYAYNNAEEITTATPRAGAPTYYCYDAAGQLTSEQAVACGPGTTATTASSITRKELWPL
jgi:YD repeat-containing protein